MRKMSKKIKSLKALRNNTEKKKDIQKINSTVQLIGGPKQKTGKKIRN